ncbi:hypothetical protein [Microbispora sp. ATCC PTA-5024]|uniref:hypothetical protein n=1 Tax=Microbispora sp. ATCC PTA-5024 TaxID=316330 RepID=UPI0003DBE1CF|nr:hypothetical protein [Microbispora sp. ATCC PTA-5024]ETK36123.1 hypothetical protein MPTA5024_10890 [Microbispora sp. ATCC PTA-5024]
MAVASAYRIPRSQLLGREPAQIVEVEYDRAGRLVRAVVTSEPRWTPEDVAWALAKMAEDADRCPGCHLSLTETTAMKDGEPVHSYKVDHPRRCQACDEKLKQQEAHAKRGKVERPDALIWEIEQES